MAIDNKTRRHLRQSGKSAIDPDAGPHEAWRAIDAANRIFGADGWSRELVEIRCAATREREGLIITAYVAKVRVSLVGPSSVGFRDAQGCGEGKGTTPFEAHNKGLKAAELDATVRALAAIGRPFGTMKLAGRSSGRSPSRRAVSTTGRAGTSEHSSARVQEGQNAEVEKPSTPAGMSIELSAAETFGKSLPPGAIVPTQQTQTDGSEGVSDQPHSAPHGEKCSTETNSLSKRPIELDPPSGTRTQPSVDTGPNVGPITNIVRARDLLPALNQGSGLLLQKQRRLRVPAHLAHVRAEPCLICGRQPCDAHHLRFMQPRAMAKKVSDEFTVPLCRRHHDLVHRDPDETEWWATHGVDPIAAAEQLWNESQEITRT